MRNQLLVAFMMGTALLLSAEVGAQAPPPATPATPPAAAPSAAPAVPEKMPFDIPYGAAIGIEQAKQVAAAAEAEAKKRNWKVGIAVVDPSGDLIYFSKMDETQLVSSNIAIKKARSATRFRRPTRFWFDLSEAGKNYGPTLDPDVVASPGGELIMAGGKIIGAIGVSGAAGVQDEVVAKAGAATVK
jgi:uncharacterized protein GlcG (DUF336 family)